MLSKIVRREKGDKVSPPCTPVAGAKHIYSLAPTDPSKNVAKKGANRSIRRNITFALLIITILSFFLPGTRWKKNNNQLLKLYESVETERMALARNGEALEVKISSQTDELIGYLGSFNAGLRGSLEKGFGLVGIEHHEGEVGNFRSLAMEQQATFDNLQSHNEEELKRLRSIVSDKQAAIDKMNADIEDNRKELALVKASINGKEVNVAKFCHQCDFNREGLQAKCGSRLIYLKKHHGVKEDAAKEVIMEQDPNCMKKDD